MDKKIFIPGKITSYVFCAILIGTLVAGILNSPLKAFNSGSIEEITFKIGYPWIFFELNPMNTESIPFFWKEMTFDLIIYFFLAYLVQIIIRIIFLPFSKNKNQEEQKENKSPETLELMKQAKIAYDYYLLQGISEQNLIEMFKNKGWTEERIKKLKEMK